MNGLLVCLLDRRRACFTAAAPALSFGVSVTILSFYGQIKLRSRHFVVFLITIWCKYVKLR
jgi:hypothetical protein